ncbi:MAG TPA: hypothetical protein VGE60_00100 [Telluria sp.]
MMNKQNHTSHTEIEYYSINAMEQAALLKARCAMARWRCCDHIAGDRGSGSARGEWYAALEQRLYSWIGHGGLDRDAGDRQPKGRTERSCVE